MCGIVGYTGTGTATDKLLMGLTRLEYRGYDSAGISIFDTNNKIKTFKTKGRIADLTAKVEGEETTANCGIGHTRWATHGVPSDVNSHPHSTDRLSLVHNGIIENYLELKEFLMGEGYTFISETDTEIAAKLMDYNYKGDPIEAIIKTSEKVEGQYAFGVVFSDFPNEIFATRMGSPLVVTKSEDGLFIASDMPAVLEYTKDYYTLDEAEIAHLSKDNGEVFYDKTGKKITKEIKTSNLTFEQAEKGGYDFFMLKEINEQPTALERTISGRVSADNLPDFKGDNIDDKFFSSFNKIYIVACGTAYYAGSLGKQIIRKIANINVSIEIASEFRYNPPVLTKNDLVLVVSQSGETADSLAALKLAKSMGIATMAIVNVQGSAIALEADNVLYTHAGPEIAVASTKAFTVQMATMYLVAIKIAMENNTNTKEQTRELVKEFTDAIANMQSAFDVNEICLECSKEFTKASSLFYIGRGHDASLSDEGALKLKEISYIHSEAYAAGELKHGTISLITDETPVIALVTDSKLAPKTISNMKEVKARGGKITAICLESIDLPKDSYDTIITVKGISDLFAPLYAIVPLQLIAYHTACLKGCDVDKPRNLAKSVTVE